MFKLEPRSAPSKVLTFASPLIALAITVIVGVILFVALGKDPVAGLKVFFVEPLKSGYALSELSLKATPLVLIALGLSVCFRANLWNIGAEGQFILGAICAGGVAMQATPESGPLLMPAVLAAGALGSWWPSSGRVCSAAWPGLRSRRCCATASTPARSWSA
jgi:general nucleoside transport system permease protein